MIGCAFLKITNFHAGQALHETARIQKGKFKIGSADSELNFFGIDLGPSRVDPALRLAPK